jgi:hypothetical protein
LGAIVGFSFAFLSCTVVLGFYLWTNRTKRLGIVHGSCAAAGLLTLALAMRRHPVAGVLAQDAIWLIGLGFCGGLFIAWQAFHGRAVPGLAFLLHATAGGLGYLLLAGLVFGH